MSASAAKTNAPSSAKATTPRVAAETIAKPVNPLWQSLALHAFAIQPKLSISNSDDPFEREADRIADQVVRPTALPAKRERISVWRAPDAQAHRKRDCCGDGDAETNQRDIATGHAETAPSTAAMVHAAMNSPGQPLDSVTREYFNLRFGHDFKSVRIHQDSTATESARGVNARAYTVGHDVVFGPGEYRPETNVGRRLLAHELTHVVQQGTSSGELKAGAPLLRTPLDAQPHRESVGEPTQGRGHERHDYTEEARGEIMHGSARYQWGVIENLLWIRVRIGFTRNCIDLAGNGADSGRNEAVFHGMVESWFANVRRIWNRFVAVQAGTGQRVYIRFMPARSTNPHHTLNCIRGGGTVSNEGTLDLNMEALDNVFAHEFGHMVGLEDEYERSHAALSRITGTAPVEGTHPPDTPAHFATRLHDTLNLPQAQRVSAVNNLIGSVSAGTWADAVTNAYRAAFGVSLYNDAMSQVNSTEAIGPLLDRFYPSQHGSVMGAQTQIISGTSVTYSPVNASPYHMRPFLAHIAAIRGGTWTAQEE
jgi:hypothetical protein